MQYNDKYRLGCLFNSFANDCYVSDEAYEKNGATKSKIAGYLNRLLLCFDIVGLTTPKVNWAATVTLFFSLDISTVKRRVVPRFSHSPWLKLFFFFFFIRVYFW